MTHPTAKKITFVSNGRRMARLPNQLAAHFDTSSLALDELRFRKPGEITIVDIDLRDPSQVQTVKQWLDGRPSHGKVIVAIDNKASRIQTIQAYALGATLVISGTMDWNTVRSHLSGGVASLDTDGRADNAPGFRALHGMFATAESGKAPEPELIKEASTEVVAELGRVGLEKFLDVIRQHHSQTYQHCLTVTAIAAAFGKHLGFSRHDTETLAFAGLLHDVGKSKIPIRILEKPSALEESEAELMKSHPMLGHELLRNHPDFSGDMLDMVLHHHEYLDGSGYPHGLKGNQISDLVRMITIADVYGALIERRAYKMPLSGMYALEILRAMGGKLDGALVGEFAPVVQNLA